MVYGNCLVIWMPYVDVCIDDVTDVSRLGTAISSHNVGVNVLACNKFFMI